MTYRILLTVSAHFSPALTIMSFDREKQDWDRNELGVGGRDQPKDEGSQERGNQFTLAK